MRGLIIALLVAVSSFSLANGSTAFCDGICEIPLDMDCETAIDTLEFQGDCCSLQQANGTCTLVSTSQCYYQEKGATGCTTQPDGSEPCVIPGVQYTAQTDEPCPQSEFVVPMTETETMNTTNTSEPAEGGSTAPASSAAFRIHPVASVLSASAFAIIVNYL